MKLEQKISEIGLILADIQFQIRWIKKNQKELRDFITNPNKLDAERYIKKSSQKIKTRSTNEININN